MTDQAHKHVKLLIRVKKWHRQEHLAIFWSVLSYIHQWHRATLWGLFAVYYYVWLCWTAHWCVPFRNGSRDFFQMCHPSLNLLSKWCFIQPVTILHNHMTPLCSHRPMKLLFKLRWDDECKTNYSHVNNINTWMDSKVFAELICN